MSAIFDLDATARTDLGKGASRRLRRAEQVPAIVYGNAQSPQNIQLCAHKIRKALGFEAFYSHILSLKIDGKTEKVVLKALQRHPAQKVILHMDFLRVSETEKMTMKVPLRFLNEVDCAGVKAGGLITHNMTDLEIRCLAKDLPEAIEVDLIGLELGGVLHLSDIKLPEGVESLSLTQNPEHGALPVATVQQPRTMAEETAEDAADASAKAADAEQKGSADGGDSGTDKKDTK